MSVARNHQGSNLIAATLWPMGGGLVGWWVFQTVWGLMLGMVVVVAWSSLRWGVRRRMVRQRLRQRMAVEVAMVHLQSETPTPELPAPLPLPGPLRETTHAIATGVTWATRPALMELLALSVTASLALALREAWALPLLLLLAVALGVVRTGSLQRQGFDAPLRRAGSQPS